MPLGLAQLQRSWVVSSVGRGGCQRGQGEVVQTLGRGAAFSWLNGSAIDQQNSLDPQIEDQWRNESRPCVLAKGQKERGTVRDGWRDSKASNTTQAPAFTAEPSQAAKHRNEEMLFFSFFSQLTPHETQNAFSCFGWVIERGAPNMTTHISCLTLALEQTQQSVIISAIPFKPHGLLTTKRELYSEYF